MEIGLATTFVHDQDAVTAPPTPVFDLDHLGNWSAARRGFEVFICDPHSDEEGEYGVKRTISTEPDATLAPMGGQLSEQGPQRYSAPVTRARSGSKKVRSGSKKLRSANRLVSVSKRQRSRPEPEASV